jgi:chromosome segregation ATPase
VRYLQNAQSQELRMPNEGFLGWVMAGVGAVVATLTSAVAALYKAQISDLRDQLAASRESLRVAGVDHKNELTRLDVIEHELRKEIEVCKTDREDLRICLARIQTEQEIMKSRITAVEQTAKP